MVRIIDKYIEISADTVNIAKHVTCDRYVQRFLGSNAVEGTAFFERLVSRYILDHLFDLGLVREHDGQTQRALACLNDIDEVQGIAFIKQRITSNNNFFTVTTIIPSPSRDMDEVEEYLRTVKHFRNV